MEIVRANHVEHAHGDDDVRENDDYPRRHDVSSSRLLHPFASGLPQRSCQATDALRPTTQVMESTRVVGGSYLTVMAGEQTGDEGSPVILSAACRQIGTSSLGGEQGK